MSTLEEKLEEIEKKVVRLVEQNKQYRRICDDLLTVRRRLESENKTLNEMLDRIAKEIEVVAKNAQLMSETFEQDEEGKEERIKKYIHDIESSIDRLK